MKDLKMKNMKKIIIFTILIIGIILLSPILGKEVYARAGKLPAVLTKGIFKGEMDGVSKALKQAEDIYTKTVPYAQNQAYRLRNGTAVLQMVKEGDEFWSSLGTKTQKFTNPALFQGNAGIPGVPKVGALSPAKTTGRVAPVTFDNLVNNGDLFCANKGMALFQTVNISDAFGIPSDGQLVKRINHFISARNGTLASLSHRDNIQGSGLKHFDDYGYSYPASGASPARMLSHFGYNYTGSKSTYPYILKEPVPPGGSTVVQDDMIIKVRGSWQLISGEGYGMKALHRLYVAQNLGPRLAYEAANEVIRREVGNIYYNLDRNTGLPSDPTGVADSVARARTKAYYSYASTAKLTPQAAYAIAAAPKRSYPGSAQLVLWMIREGKYQDSQQPALVDYIIPSNDLNSLEIKALSEAFELYYNNLMAWKSKANFYTKQVSTNVKSTADGKQILNYANGDDWYQPRFETNDRKITFNSKSDTYAGGSWLVGPYKVDYLLNNTSHRNKIIYFAGMSSMKVTGEYIDSARKTKSTKEITKWSYFVPLEKTAARTKGAENGFGVKNTPLTNGIPEPNQEFFIEIPYDENLLGIKEIQAKFRYTDYAATTTYYVGAGEYADFTIDVAVEKLEKIAHGYRDVKIVSYRTEIPNPLEDIYRVIVEFDGPIYEYGGQTNPFEEQNVYWRPYNGNSRIVYTDVKYGSGSSPRSSVHGTFFYKYDGIVATGTSVRGGIDGSISFSRPLTTSVAIETGKLQKLQAFIWHDYGESVVVRTNYKSTLDGSNYGTSHTINKGTYPQVYYFTSIGGQRTSVTVGAKPAPTPDPEPDPTDPPVKPPVNPPRPPVPPPSINKLDVETGRTVNHGYNDPGGPSIIGGDSNGSGLLDGHTYILHKRPDVLVVPKTAMNKEITQAQQTPEGNIFTKEVEVTLKEDLVPPTPGVERPAFILPIGGKVWEDKPVGEKLPVYNFILDRDENKPEGDIYVRINRLIIRNSDKAIIEKQAARVFEKDKYDTPIDRAIKVRDDGTWGKYYLRDLGFIRSEIAKGYTSSTHIVKFEVEYEYNGIKYIPTPPLASLQYNAANYNLETDKKAVNDSMATENVIERDKFNINVGEIRGKNPMTADRKTEGAAIGVQGATGNDVVLKYDGEYSEATQRTISTLDKAVSLPMTASTLNTGLLFPLGDVYSVDINQALSNHSATSPTNGSFDLVVIMEKEKADQFRNREGVTVKAAEDNKYIVIFHEANTHMENINLGLLRRKEVDLELVSDLMLSVQFINKKALVKTFAERYSLDPNAPDPYRVMVSNFDKTPKALQYQLDVYKADYIYRTAMYQDPDLEEMLKTEADKANREYNDSRGRELDIFLQYKQGISNYSYNDQVILSGIDMYYDNSLTPIHEAISKEIDVETVENSQVTGEVAVAKEIVNIEAPRYRIVRTDDMFSRDFDAVKGEPAGNAGYHDITLVGDFKWDTTTRVGNNVSKLTYRNNNTARDGDIILPSARRFELLTNFQIDNDALYQESGVRADNALNLGRKYHLTEIAGFATYNKFNGKATGKVDMDSAPANINPTLIGFAGNDINVEDYKYLEDDSAFAPIISVELEEEAPRKVSGMLWEEIRNNQTARVNLGDGIYNKAEGEKAIANKVLALEERVSIKAVDISTEYKMKHGLDNKILKDTEHYYDIPYIWPDKIDAAGIKVDSLKALTGFQSYLRTGTEGNYEFEGIPAGNFVTQVPYITVGDDVTQALGILNKGAIETTKIVEAENRDKSPQVYNGQDFKVAIYDAGKSNANVTWLPVDTNPNHSYGRDSEYERFKQYAYSKVINGRRGDAITILNVDYDRLNANTEEGASLRQIVEQTANMTAETPVMNFGIEHYSGVNNGRSLYKGFAGIFRIPGITIKNGNVENDIDPSTRGYKNVNIAFEERAKPKLVLDKQVSRITLKNSDGNKIVDATYTTTYDYDHIVMPDTDKAVLAAAKTDGNYDARRKTNNGYSTPEYVLKVKTEVDNDSLNGDKVTPLNTSIYATKKPYWEAEQSADGLYTNARGWENINQKDAASRNSNGYIHLNFDKQLLSDTNIEIEYEVRLYNIGEVDRSPIQSAFATKTLEQMEKDEKASKYVGKFATGTEKYSKLNHELIPETYGYGRVFGQGYYTGKFVSADAVTKTYANKIIDYIDNSAVKDEQQNDVWTQVKDISELNNLVAGYDENGKKTFDLTPEMMVDPDMKSYFTTGGSNIYITDKLATGLIPYYEFATELQRGKAEKDINPCAIGTTIAIKRLSSQQADDDLSFDNLVEIVEYSSDNGRRTPSSTPGNVITRESDTFSGIGLEPDTGLALLVTITPPTGLSKAERTVFSALTIVLGTMAVVAMLAITAKVILDKQKEKSLLPNEIGNIDENKKE